AFRAKYNVPITVQILGPYRDVLSDPSVILQLERPGVPETAGVPYIGVDEVRYQNTAPWPPGADGGGPSLHRLNASAYGNDPVNWLSAIPPPGRIFAGADTDGAGLPDWWAVAHGTNPLVADADDDPDGDGFTNLHESLAGTDPQNKEDVLRLTATI